MNDLEELRKQIADLQSKVSVLENEPCEPITKKLSRLKAEIFNRYFDYSAIEKERGRYEAYHERTNLRKAISDISISTTKAINETLISITQIARSEDGIKQFLNIYEHYCKVCSQIISKGESI